jgi:predicted RNase H-like HicB family nuclease
MMRQQYIALIRADEHSDYGVSFPDLPGCISAGQTIEEARALAEEALALHLEGLAEDGEAIPEPSSLDAVMADPDNRDGLVMLIPAPQRPTRTVRINITLPEDVLERIDRYAKSHGYNRSGLLILAVKRFMEMESA